jgi:tetrahydromethanopterin S-methyltransferase subunit G
METLENKPYTFWELLNKVGIKIPIIQRDYAQGRNTNNVKRIRENFLNTLYKTLEEEKQLDLDFVYGSVKDNYLIPLDGQQRLTTLFLLHYFLALKENKLNDNIKEILKKFTYETRISSREFIKQLIEKNINLDERKISEIIKDQTWFFSEWENDPTITSMLNMLDSIQEKFKNTENFFEKLINKRIITFSFLNLKEFKLTDELYVKMNARGKPLTEFENFKSKFEECINKADGLEEKEKIKAKLDNKWLDFFWNKTIEELKEKKQFNNYSLSSETDKKFYNFFYNITFIFYLETLKNEEKLKLNNKEFSTIKEFIDNISIFDFYQEVYKNPQKIKEIEKILDNLKEIEKKLTDKNEKEIFKRIISTKNIGQNEIAKFYSVVLGIIYELNSQEFNRWVRVTFNLINNQLIQSSKDLIKAIQALRNLITKSSKDIYDYIAKSSENIEYFSEIQKKEESLKACLILNNLSYENEFIKAENHWYLKGQIGFLISYTAKNDYFDVKEFKKYDINHLKEKYSKEFNINEFNKYRDKFIKLWDFTNCLLYTSPSPRDS